mmetsp:Transcript_17009/g.30849  ORF Transcript_17009/g.30849 Transcript_17009/m.30849 type:complete len:237 (-) Transcript_17009:435-1145(-)
MRMQLHRKVLNLRELLSLKTTDPVSRLAMQKKVVVARIIKMQSPRKVWSLSESLSLKTTKPAFRLSVRKKLTTEKTTRLMSLRELSILPFLKLQTLKKRAIMLMSWIITSYKTSSPIFLMMTKVFTLLAVHLVPLEVTTMIRQRMNQQHQAMNLLHSRCMTFISGVKVVNQLYIQWLRCSSLPQRNHSMTTIMVKNRVELLILMMKHPQLTNHFMAFILGWTMTIPRFNLIKILVR